MGAISSFGGFWVGADDLVTDGIYLWQSGAAVADWPYIWAQNYPTTSTA
jgi:hypothetical protein